MNAIMRKGVTHEEPRPPASIIPCASGPCCATTAAAASPYTTSATPIRRCAVSPPTSESDTISICPVCKREHLRLLNFVYGDELDRDNGRVFPTKAIFNGLRERI